MPAGREGREQQEAAPTQAAETLPDQRKNKKKIKIKQQIGFSFRIQNLNASTQQQKGFRRETVLPGEKPQRAGNAPSPSWPRHVHQPSAHRCWQHPNTAQGISGLTSHIRAAAPWTDISADPSPSLLPSKPSLHPAAPFFAREKAPSYLTPAAQRRLPSHGQAPRQVLHTPLGMFLFCQSLLSKAPKEKMQREVIFPNYLISMRHRGTAHVVLDEK